MSCGGYRCIQSLHCSTTPIPPLPRPLSPIASRERVLANLEGRPVDRLPLMPITMMFAAVQTGARYRDYCTDYRVLVEAQIRTAEAFGFDYVNTMSDPAREAADCGAAVEYFRQPARRP